jgi:hypothetical protein
MKTALIFVALVVGFFGGQHLAVGGMEPYDYGFGTGFGKGYELGKHDALLPTASNHKLETVCLNMWVSQQVNK